MGRVYEGIGAVQTVDRWDRNSWTRQMWGTMRPMNSGWVSFQPTSLIMYAYGSEYNWGFADFYVSMHYSNGSAVTNEKVGRRYWASPGPVMQLGSVPKGSYKLRTMIRVQSFPFIYGTGDWDATLSYDSQISPY